MNALKSRKANIKISALFLQGVYKEECRGFDDMIKDKMYSDEPIYTNITFDKMPTMFTTLDSWPKNINLCCWWCERIIKKAPLAMAVSIEPLSNSNTGMIGNIVTNAELKRKHDGKHVVINTEGVFCIENCVQAYINLHSKDLAEKHNRTEMLKFLSEKIRKKVVLNIQPSPSPYIMSKFCGEGGINEQEYQHLIDMLDVAYIKELEDSTNMYTAYEKKINE